MQRQVQCEHVLFDPNVVGLQEQLDWCRQHHQLSLPDNVTVKFFGWCGQTPQPFIAYDCEQHHRTSVTPSYWALMKRAVCIWTFSELNAEYWREQHGIPAFYVPMWLTLPRRLWSPTPETEAGWAAVPESQYDVIMYGTITERRTEMEPRFQTVGLATKFGYFGHHVPHGLVDESRIVANIKFYTHGALEVHRINPLLCAGKSIVTEESIFDLELDQLYRDAGIPFTSYENFPDTVARYVRDPVLRKQTARAGQLWIRQQCQDRSPLVAALRETIKLL